MRIVSPEFAAGLVADVVFPAMLVEGLFDSGPVRFWSGLGDLSWNGHSWSGAGNLLAIAPIAEKGTIEAVGTSITLSGIPADLVQLALAESYQGRIVRIYMLLFTAGTDAVIDYVTTSDGSDYLTTRSGDRLYVTVTPATPGGEIIASPDERFTGRADVMSLSDDGLTAMITLTVESRMIDLQRPRTRRYTNDDHRTYYPNDRGFEYVATLQDQELKWGNG